MRDFGSLWTKQAHNLPPETFTRELNRIYDVEAGFPEGVQRSEIAFLRIGNDCADAGVRKDELVEELADYNRTQPQACHFKFSDCEVDTSRSRFRSDLSRMVWVVSPEIPLNPADRPEFLFDHEHIRRLGTVNARSVFRLNTRQIIPLVPPGSHVGGGEPFLKQREVASFKWPE
jgi:hypothetical protein